jgi:hypothetical protein
MDRNGLYLIIGVLVILLALLGGYIIYEQTRPKGVELRIDQSGISVQQK